MQSPKFELDNNTTIDNKHPSLRTVLYATQEDREKVCNIRVLLQLLKDSLSPSIHWTHHALGISQHYETVNLVSFLTVWLCLVKEMTTKDINKKESLMIKKYECHYKKTEIICFSLSWGSHAILSDVFSMIRVLWPAMLHSDSPTV